MRDAEIVASVVAGDPVGIAEAYDGYADPLYAYCRFMLDDPADAAAAVRDTFLIAAWRLGRLRDPERLRPWLYAVARNECLRQLRARQAASALDTLADMAVATFDISEDAEHAELRAQVLAAVGILDSGERDLIVLHLGQELRPAEVALVLGISDNRAYSLLSRASARMQAYLNVPAAALAMVMAESTRLAGDAPAGLRDHLLWMATTENDDALTHQADLRSRVRAFGRAGFPKPLPMPKGGWYRSPQGRAVVLGGAAAAVVAFVVTLALTGNWSHVPAVGSNAASNASAQPASPAAAATGAAPVPVYPFVAGPPPTPSISASTTAPALVATRPSGRPSVRHPATTSAPATPSGRRSTAPVPSASSGTPAPSPTSPSATPTPSQTPGTLVVSTGTLDLNRSNPTGTITLTAENGPVTWSISQTGGVGALVISPAEGELADGQSVQVTVSAAGATQRFTAELVMSPGGQTVTVVYSARSF